MAIELGGSGRNKTPMRGAAPSMRSALAAAVPHTAAAGAPPPQPNFLILPHQISSWGNFDHGDCVTAEEAFAKACHKPEIFITDQIAIGWATKHDVLDGANIHQVMQWMQKGGFHENGKTFDDGKIFSVDWTDPSTLHSAISEGPVKIGVAATQLETAWRTTNGQTGWFGLGFKKDTAEDHCVSLCGYGSLAWLAGQLKVIVPAGVDGTKPGYALFTWDSIGIVDQSSLNAITEEAWLRSPTTVIRSGATAGRPHATA
jgi:hypothetical protein